MTQEQWIEAARGLLERLVHGSQSPAVGGLRHDSLRDVQAHLMASNVAPSPAEVSLNRHIAHAEALLRTVPK